MTIRTVRLTNIIPELHNPNKMYLNRVGLYLD